MPTPIRTLTALATPFFHSLSDFTCDLWPVACGEVPARSRGSRDGGTAPAVRRVGCPHDFQTGSIHSSIQQDPNPGRTAQVTKHTGDTVQPESCYSHPVWLHGWKGGEEERGQLKVSPERERGSLEGCELLHWGWGVREPGRSPIGDSVYHA